MYWGPQAKILATTLPGGKARDPLDYGDTITIVTDTPATALATVR